MTDESYAAHDAATSDRSTTGGPAAVRTRPPGHDPIRGGLRFLTEIIAWVGTPWALWSLSVPIAIASVLALIGLPAVFSTPGDRPGGDGPVAVPGQVTIALLLLQLVAATAAAWWLWPTWVAVVVTALCLVVCVTEQPRWRSLVATSASRRRRLA